MRVSANEDHRYRVFLDDVDVSSDAVFADDKAGEVGLIQRDDEGRTVFVDGYIAMVTRRGAVRIEFAP